MKSKSPGRPVNLATFTPKVAFSEPLPITFAKKKDLLELCDMGVIPQQHVSYFRDLKALRKGEKKQTDFYEK